MFTRDPDASFDTPNVVIGRQGRNELTLSFRPDPYLSTLLTRCKSHLLPASMHACPIPTTVVLARQDKIAAWEERRTGSCTMAEWKR